MILSKHICEEIKVETEESEGSEFIYSITESFTIMNHYLKILLFLLLPYSVNAQRHNVDSLQKVFNHASDNQEKFNSGREIYDFYEELNKDSALYYAGQTVLLARENQQKIPEAYGLVLQAYQLMGLGRFAEALQCVQKSFALCEDEKNGKNEWDLHITGFNGDKRLLALSITHHVFALLMVRADNLEQQIIHFKEAERLGSAAGWGSRVLLADMNLGQSYLSINKPDSALLYEKEAERFSFQTNDKKYLGIVDAFMGDIYKALGNDSLALQYYYKGLGVSMQEANRSGLSRNYLRLIKYHLATGNKDSALYYSEKNLETIQSMGPITGTEINIGSAYENMYLSYQLDHQFDSAFKYLRLTSAAKDSINKLRIKNLTEFQNLLFAEQLRLKNIEQEKIIYQNKVRTYFLLSGIAVLLLLAIIFYRNNRQKQKAKIKIEKAYNDLKATQQQLIQSEKMASLGELTAGIAHEIQNPLNFVNNFSEVNKELLEELKAERLKPKSERDEQIQDEVIDNVIGNEKKINHHGRRADAIVKGMLQHARATSSQKEPTGVNALADEYLRLSYHGLRAKDKTFNATMQTDFDSSVGEINIIPQDIGRVLLNLFNNAFYALNEKQKQNIAGYEPTLFVSTKKTGDRVEIRVKDNGNGIPQKVIDKIFQPFFTTKPTGQGTGLGLSLSYDIIKAHGGEIKAKTKEGEGAEFIIHLPI